LAHRGSFGDRIAEMKDVLAVAAAVFVALIVGGVLYWLQFGWLFAVVVSGTMGVIVLGCVIWWAIAARRRGSGRQ